MLISLRAARPQVFTGLDLRTASRYMHALAEMHASIQESIKQAKLLELEWPPQLRTAAPALQPLSRARKAHAQPIPALSRPPCALRQAQWRVGPIQRWCRTYGVVLPLYYLLGVVAYGQFEWYAWPPPDRNSKGT